MIETTFPDACPACGRDVTVEFYTETRYVGKAEPGHLHAELYCTDEDCSYNPALDVPIYEMLREFKMVSAPWVTRSLAKSA